MEMTQAAMVYADHYQQIDGVQKTAPVIDYQPGSLRDDFNFGSVLLFNANAFKEVIEKCGKKSLRDGRLDKDIRQFPANGWCMPVPFQSVPDDF